MAHISRRGAIGIGIEAVAGTSVTPTHWIQFSSDPKLNDKFEFDDIVSARGRVEKSQGQKVMKKQGEGSVEMILDQTISVIPFGMILGSVSSATAGGGMHEHTITIDNINTPKTATLVFDRVADIRKFTGAVVVGLELKVSDSFAMLKMDFVSNESSTASASPSYSTITNFSFKELSAQFGVDVASADIASPTPLSGADLKITRKGKVIYQSGSNSPAKIVHEVLDTNGGYTLLFENSIDRDKYLGNTSNALILKFTDENGNIVKIILPKVLLSNWDPSNSMNTVVVQNADFSAHYDATATESIRVIITNTTASYANLSA